MKHEQELDAMEKKVPFTMKI